MTGNINFFSDLRDIHSIVGLPNRNKAIATKKGIIKLIDQFVFHNVLYVPSLTCNLMSVSQLLEEHSYHVLFTHKFCIIQALNLKNLIGAGVQCNGVYLLQIVPDCSFQANADGVPNASLLWRIGHPSMKVLHLSLVFSCGKNNVCGMFDCSIFFHGKTTSEFFSFMFQ